MNQLLTEIDGTLTINEPDVNKLVIFSCYIGFCTLDFRNIQQDKSKDHLLPPIYFENISLFKFWNTKTIRSKCHFLEVKD